MPLLINCGSDVRDEYNWSKNLGVQILTVATKRQTSACPVEPGPLSGCSTGVSFAQSAPENPFARSGSKRKSTIRKERPQGSSSHQHSYRDPLHFNKEHDYGATEL